MRPWTTLDRLPTREGLLELRQRGERDFLITIGGRVLMTSVNHRSEDALATAACAASPGKAKPRILLGGLGMGLSLRAALDVLSRKAEVTVAELSERVVDWCRGPLRGLTNGAVEDPRVRVHIGDVAGLIAEAEEDALDAIILDLYEGPHAVANRWNDPLYGHRAIENAYSALKVDGVFAVWSEEPDHPFEQRLESTGFTVTKQRAGGGRVHVIYLAKKTSAKASAAARSRPGAKPPR